MIWFIDRGNKNADNGKAVVCVFMHRPVQREYAAKAAHGSHGESGKKFQPKGSR